jgi:RNA polymerase sigma factor (sigma-70 family)
LLTQSDARLVRLAGEGHERAFEALVHRYRRPLLGYCRRLLLPSERAEDALQQGLLQAWLALQNGAEVQNARPWLYRIVHNAALNMLRVSGYDYAKLSETLRGADAPDEDLDRRIAVREAFAGLAALPAMQREALLRTAVDGYSHEQVAQALGLTEGALRGLVYRARATLRTATTALTPSPVVSWALNHRGVASAPLASRLAEMGAGGGSVGVTGLLLKGGAAVVTAGALAGGIATERHRHSRAPAHPAGAATETVAGTTIQPTASIDRLGLAQADTRAPAAGHAHGHGPRGVVVLSRQPSNAAFGPGADTSAGGSSDRSGGHDAGGGGSMSGKSGSGDGSGSGSKDGSGSPDKVSTGGKDLSGSGSTEASSTSSGSAGSGDSGSNSTSGGSTSTDGGSTSGGSISGGSSSGGLTSGSGSSDSGSGSGSTDGGSASTSDGSTSGDSGSGGSWTVLGGSEGSSDGLGGSGG